MGGSIRFVVIWVNWPFRIWYSPTQQGQDSFPAFPDCGFYTSTDVFSGLYKGVSTESGKLPDNLEPAQPGGTHSPSPLILLGLLKYLNYVSVTCTAWVDLTQNTQLNS